MTAVGFTQLLSANSLRRAPWAIMTAIVSLAGGTLPLCGSYIFTTLTNGVGNAALFGAANSVVVDASGNTFVSDAFYHSIRKVTPDGVVTSFVGLPGIAGSADGVGTAARFQTINKLTMDQAGNLYALDAGIGSGGSYLISIRKVTPAGQVETVFSSTAEWGAAGSDPWWDRSGFAVDQYGDIFLHDAHFHRICKILPTGEVTTLSSGTTEPSGDMMLDHDGNLYVAALGSYDPRLIKVAPDGSIAIVLHPDAFGRYPGPAGPVSMGGIDGMAMDASGNIWAANSGSCAIYMISPSGDVTLVAGGNGSTGIISDGTGTLAFFDQPNGLAILPGGNIVVADHSCVRRMTPVGVVTTIAGVPHYQGSADGTGTNIGMNSPMGVAGPDSSGNIYVADRANAVVLKINPQGDVAIFAGMIGQTGYADGTGTNARFTVPQGVALDGFGNVFVAEGYILRKISANGEVTSFAGSNQSGSQDGVGAAARFNALGGITADSAGNVYVTDSGNYTVRKISPDGTVTTLAGHTGQRGNQDGTGSSALFWNLGGITVDSFGNLFVTDYTTVRKITPAGVVTTVAGTFGSVGSMDGVGTTAQFYGLAGIAVDAGENLFVSESGGRIRMITPAGVVTTIGGPPTDGLALTGDADGIGSVARFGSPSGIAIDALGHLFIADTSNRSVRQAAPLAGEVPVISTSPADATIAVGGTATFGVVASSGLALSYRWQKRPEGSRTWVDLSNDTTFAGVTSNSLVLRDAQAAMNGDQYRCLVSNAQNVAISSLAALTVIEPSLTVISQPHDTAASGGFSAFFSADATAVPNTISGQWQQSLDGGATWSNLTEGNGPFSGVTLPTLKVNSDLTMNGRQFRCVVSNGWAAPVATSAATLTVFPTTPYSFSTVGVVENYSGSSALLWYYSDERSIALDQAGGVYVARRLGQTILRIQPGASVDSNSFGFPAAPTPPVSILAGVEGQTGSVDGIGASARFSDPVGMAVDNAGNVFVADSRNHTIRRITSQGAVTTFAGLAGQSGSADGTGAAARFNTPTGLAIDSAGNLYVADSGNSTVRKITTTGLVTTVAGTAGQTGSIDGSGMAARFWNPWGIAVDATGAIFVTDSINCNVRKITASGVVTTLAGLAKFSGYADGTGTNARFATPLGIAVDGVGTLYVADEQNDMIRRISPDGTVTSIAGLIDQYDAIAGTGWYSDGTGVTARFCAPIDVAIDSSGTLYVVDAGDAAVRKGTAVPFGIVMQPSNTQVAAGATATISVGTAGTVNYQWRKDGIVLNNGGRISGATAPNLTITGAQIVDTGSYDVVISNLSNVVTSDAATLTVFRINQTIVFGALSDRAFSNAAIALNASSDSGLPVSFGVVSGPATVSGNLLTLTGTGTITVRASQAGDGTYAPAPDVDRSFNVTGNFASWSTGKFTAGELADVNISGPNAVYGQDGLPNLVKYALGLEPKQNITTGLPAVTTTATDWVYTYTRPSDRTDITYDVEMSTDLVIWTSAPNQQMISSGGGNETWTASYPLASAVTIFFRLRVVSP